MGDNGLWKSAVLASQLGFSVACPLTVFIAGGVWADDKLQTKPWLFFLGLLVGVVAAGAALYQVAAAQPKKRATAAAKPAPDKIEPAVTGGAEGAKPSGKTPTEAENDDDYFQFED